MLHGHGFAHTLYSYSSALSWARGRQIWKFGGEQRLFFNNFFQPATPPDYFNFTQGVTEQVIGAGDPDQGNSFASLLLGYGDLDSSLGRFRLRGQQVERDSFLFSGRLESDLEAHREFGSALRMEHALLGAEQPGSVQRFYRRHGHCCADQSLTPIPNTGP